MQTNKGSSALRHMYIHSFMWESQMLKLPHATHQVAAKRAGDYIYIGLSSAILGSSQVGGALEEDKANC